MANSVAPSISAAARSIEVRTSPALSGWRAIASIADLPILPIPKAAPNTAMAAARAAIAVPIPEVADCIKVMIDGNIIFGFNY